MAVINYRQASGAIYLGRNFYGSLRVTDLPLATPEMQRASCSTAPRSRRAIHVPGKAEGTANVLFPGLGVGLALDELGKQDPLSVGVIGLGTGTIGTYCRPGDAYRFYDINPMVKSIALNEFYYLRACPRETTIVLGDARLSLNLRCRSTSTYLRSMPSSATPFPFTCSRARPSRFIGGI